MSRDTTMVVAGFKLLSNRYAYCVRIIQAADNIYDSEPSWARAVFLTPGGEWFSGRKAMSRAIQHAREQYKELRSSSDSGWELEYDHIPLIQVSDTIRVVSRDCRA